MKKLFLLLVAGMCCGSLSAQFVKSKTVEDGGTGPFKAIAVQDAALPDFVIYRPQDMLLANARCGQLPLLIWGNGGCSDANVHYEKMLSEIASHGYIVLAVGEFQDQPYDRKEGHSESADLKRGLDWICGQVNTPGSDYYHNIDTLRVAAAGHSCGGAQVLANASDSRLKTYLIMNAGMGDIDMAGASRASLPNVHGPILYVTGGPSDVAYENAKKDFSRLGEVPAVWADHAASGHGGTYGEAHGGDYTRLMVDWLDWQLKGQTDRAETFLGGEAKGYDGWTIGAKNFVDFKHVRPLWIMNGDRQIYGELYTPEGTVRGTAIVAHGFNSSYQDVRGYFNTMKRLGFQCYVFDFPCGSVRSRSDSNTVNMSILDEQSDVRAIVNYFRAQNPHQEIVLIGESQGGLVSALTAAQLGDDVVTALVLVYPALSIPENWRHRYPQLSDIPEITNMGEVKLGRRFFEEIHDMKPLEIIGKYRGPVLIVQGDKDFIVPVAGSERAQKLYNDARLHIIPGAGHGFNAKEFEENSAQIEKFLAK